MKRANLAGYVLGLVMLVVGCHAAHAAAFRADDVAEGDKPPEEEKPPSTIKVVASYALGVVGILMMLPALLKTFSSNMSYPVARNMLVNLLRTNPYNAAAVCKTTKGSFFEPIGAALTTGASTQSQDPKIVTMATIPTYDGIATGVSEAAKQLVGKGKLGAMAAGGGLVVALTSGAPPILVVVFGVLACAGFGWLFLYQREVARSLMLARAEVLPEVDRAICDGRFRVAPPAQ